MPAPRQPRQVYYLRFFWDHRRFAGRTAVLGFLLSVGIAFIIPKRYEATARLMPPDWGGTNSLSSTLLGMVNPGNLTGSTLNAIEGRTAGATFVGVLQSRTVADDLINQFDLRDVYRMKLPEDLRKALQAHTSISEDRKSGIITITVTDRDPQRAAKMAQAYTVELNRLVGQLDVSAAGRERQFLQGQLAIVQKALESSEVALSRFSSKNMTLDVAEQGRTMMTAAAQVEGQLIAAEMELQGLRQIYADDNVRVRSAEARVSELRSKLNQLGGDAGPNASSSDSSSDLPYPSLREFPLLGTTYADLSRSVKINEMVYELLTRQYELAKIEEARQIPSVKELDVPVAPQKKSFPPRTFIVLLGTLFFTSCACAWLIGKQAWLNAEESDPRKQLARDVFDSLRSRFARRGSVHS